MTDAETILDEACALGAAILEAKAEITARVVRRRMLWLQANRAGLRYRDIAQRCGVSEVFVTKEIRAARSEHPDLAASPGRKATA